MGFSENSNPFAGAGAAEQEQQQQEDKSQWLTSPATHPCLYNVNTTREYTEFGARVEEDPLMPLWLAIDWSDTCVAGSFALNAFLRMRQLTGPELGLIQPPCDNWQPDDLDVMIHCESRGEFESKAKVLELRLPELRLTKSQWYPDDISQRVEYFKTMHSDKQHLQTEIFHYCIRGMNTYSYEPLGLPIQLVCFSSKWGMEPTASIEHILDRILDYPSCVTFRVRPWGSKCFRVYDNVVSMLITRCVPVGSVCGSRLEKYQRRGFRFVPGYEVYDPLIRHIKRYGYPQSEKHLEDLLEGFSERALQHQRYSAEREMRYAQQRMAGARAAASAAEILFRSAVKEAVEQRALEEQQELAAALGSSSSDDEQVNSELINFAVALGELDLSDDDIDESEYLREHLEFAQNNLPSDGGSSSESVIKSSIDDDDDDHDGGVLQVTSELNDMEL